eukprot:8286710-Prorocentrum_lima.AAC.1
MSCPIRSMRPSSRRCENCNIENPACSWRSWTRIQTSPFPTICLGASCWSRWSFWSPPTRRTYQYSCVSCF